MRIIDADNLKKQITETVEAEGEIDLKWSKGLNYSLKMIDNAPTVPNEYMRGYEAAEREYKRSPGEWIRKVDEVGFISYICSKCGAEIEVEDCSDDKFCFNCGADMKGEINK